MMTSRKVPYCSDAELLKELKKLGYNDISPDVFKRMKEDISLLVEEEYPSEAPRKLERTLSSSTVVKYSGTHSNYEDVKAKYAGKLKSRLSVEPEISHGSPSLEDDRYAKYRNRLNAFKLNSYARNSNDETDSPNVRTETSSSSLSRSYSRLQAKYGLSGKLPEIAKLREPDRNVGPDSEDPLDKYRERFKLGAFSQRSNAPNGTTEVSQSSENILLPSSEVRYKRSAIPQRSNLLDDDAAEVPRSSENILIPSSEVRYKHSAIPQQSNVMDDAAEVPCSSDSLKSPSSKVQYRLGAFSQRSSVLDKNADISRSSDSLTSPSSKVRYKLSAFSQQSNVPDENADVSRSSDSIASPSSKVQYKLGAFSHRLNVQDKIAEVSPSLDSIASSEVRNKMKRKVLRRRNGEPVLTEEYLDMPNIFNTSYPETESGKSFSSDELSFKSNGSTGSIVSPDVTVTTKSASQSSFSTPRSIHTRIANQRKKKTDPVAMYNYYKNYWNNFKPPGEKTHDKLRWAVRDRMLDYNL